MRVVCKDLERAGWDGNKLGLTEGKVYEVQAVVMGTNTLASNMDNARFLVYNDDQYWDVYKCNIFVPYVEKM